MIDSSATPDPSAWPRCRRCNVDYVLRRAHTLMRGPVWIWQPDCKHLIGHAVVVKRGEVSANG